MIYTYRVQVLLITLLYTVFSAVIVELSLLVVYIMCIERIVTMCEWPIVKCKTQRLEEVYPKQHTPAHITHTDRSV